MAHGRHARKSLLGSGGQKFGTFAAEQAVCTQSRDASWQELWCCIACQARAFVVLADRPLWEDGVDGTTLYMRMRSSTTPPPPRVQRTIQSSKNTV